MLLATGAVAPWLTVAGVGIGGLTLEYGYLALGASALALLCGYLTTCDTTRRVQRAAGGLAGTFAIVSIVSAVNVGWAVSSDHTRPRQADGTLAAAVTAVLHPRAALGLWLVVAGAALAVGLALPSAVRAAERLRWRITVGALTLLIGATALTASNQRAVNAEHQSQARAEAAAREQQRQQEEAAAERARAEAAEAADRRKFRIHVSTCTQDSYGGTTLAGTLTNESGRARTYRLEIPVYDDGGNEIGVAYDVLSDVGPGAKRRWEGMTFERGVRGCPSDETVRVGVSG